MRHGQARLVDDLVPVQEEVEVDRSRSPALLAHAAETLLDRDQALEELLRPYDIVTVQRTGRVALPRLERAAPPGMRVAG